jgi:hypothetical protein
MCSSGSQFTHLGTICVERRLFVPQLDCFGVKLQGSRPIMVLERFVALVLELRGFVLWASHDGR